MNSSPFLEKKDSKKEGVEGKPFPRDLKKLYFEVFGEELESNIAKIAIKGNINDKRLQNMAEIIFRNDKQYILYAEQVDDYVVFFGLEFLNTKRKREYNVICKGDNIQIYYFND